MSIDQIRLLVLLVGITLISGIGDSQGFVHAARMWQDCKVVWIEFGRSAVGFGVGIAAYWVAARYLNEFGVLSAETQTLIWFGVTILGVALASGKFIRWQTIDQLVAVVVLLGIGWLMFHTGDEVDLAVQNAGD
jgi:hypothetical protein